MRPSTPFLPNLVEKMRILVVIGTRPEAIKLAPIVLELRKFSHVKCQILSTGQHRDLLQQVLDYFGVTVDYALDVMQHGQSLGLLTAKLIERISSVLDTVRPDWIVVQGDTSTTIGGAISGFLAGVPIAHVEAGLRTMDISNPFPEEFHRRVVSDIARLHFAPTAEAAGNLISEGVPKDRIFVVGNTVSDALIFDSLKTSNAVDSWQAGLGSAIGGRRIVLVTSHRRENQGAGLHQLCRAIAAVASEHCNFAFIFPVHPSPAVRQVVHTVLNNTHNVYLLAPLSYPEFVNLERRAHLIVTDSGGVQEEAAILGKPSIIFRRKSDRPESIHSGAAITVNLTASDLADAIGRLLDDGELHASMCKRTHPFGAGDTSRKIVETLLATQP